MRSTIVLALVVVCAALLMSSAPLSAHHAFAATFDTSKPITVKGVVTEDRIDQSPFLVLAGREESGRHGG